MNGNNRSKTLVRSRKDRMLAGVCAGVADYVGVDVTLVRVLVVVLCLITGGAGVLAYVAAWVIIPEEGQNDSIAGNLFTKNRGS
jgi:phage shock protein C